MSPIYLDHGATTPLDPQVAAGLAERHLNLFGNPKSSHPLGRAAGKVLADSRARVARAIGGRAEQLIFTSGGTEALAMAIFGSSAEGEGRIAVSAIEHSAVIEAAQFLVRHRGWAVDVIPVDGEGRVTPAAVAATVGPKTRIVCVMLANNEIGTINDLPGIARVVRAESRRAKLIVDAVQALGKLTVDVKRLDADCVAITAHKLHGPKGVGALWSRSKLQPLIKGGGQEAGIRGGTQSAPLAWAFAEAIERHRGTAASIRALRDRLWAQLSAQLPEATVTGAPFDGGRLINNLHVLIPNVPGEPLLNALSAAGVCASAGSACGGGKFSRVLDAMGRREQDGAYLRLTPGRFTTEAEIDTAAGILVSAVRDLRLIYR